MNMSDKIRKQISDEIFSKISSLESESDQEKQIAIAQDIIRDLNIEDFEPYLVYDGNGDIYIALNYRYGGKTVENAQISGQHDVMLHDCHTVHIEDEAYLNELFCVNLSEQEEQKTYDDTMCSIERINNHLQDLVNFQRPKYVGNIHTVEQLMEIDDTIQSYSRIVDKLEESLNYNETKITYGVIAKAVGKTESAIKYWAKTNPTLLELVKLGLIAKMHGLGNEEKIIAVKKLVKNL